MKTNYETLVDLVIKAEVANKPRHEILLQVGPTPAVLLKVGLAPLPLVLTAATVGKIFFDHGLTQHQIEKVPALIERPRAIYRSATQPESVVVMTLELKEGSPIIIPVARDRRMGRDLLANQVTSMYAKTGPDVTPRWKEEGLLLWESAP